MDCPACGARDVIEIKHRLPDGTQLDFFSCHMCDERWWDRQGDNVTLKEVLDLARRLRR
ncbi:MAG: hypothetical protein KatS3mg011_1097 [Acidimicrobiia bacterium]|jgi:transposase-like protein|nr:MAG: hypothetical protein KatS3mg011_1097 [Acidimicrobiia bacterium]